MPPKKVSTKRTSTKKSVSNTAKDEAKTDNHETRNSSIQDTHQQGRDSGTKSPVQQKKPSSKKRNVSDGEEEAPEQKALRRSGRSVKPSKKQLLSYLLSKDCDDLLRPEDEVEDIKKRGPIETYSTSVLNVFEELMSAVILSRPINHKLGLRSIRTVLNDPYNFTCAKAIQDAGADKTHQAMWDARTQHKGKTAEQLSTVADIVLKKFSAANDRQGQHLQKTLADNSDDPDKALDALQKEIKGFGEIVSKIFLRRVQWLWQSAFPYVDNVSSKGLKALGLPEEAENLHKLLCNLWTELDTAYMSSDVGDDEKKLQRRAFVVLVERATSCQLESKTTELLAAATAFAE